ncbi:Outer membrane lipoprotein carrier protein LolA [hydrothermal vent metagenome]|uniref:Outer membrane lipoprotein carrier protein LolA n=1 Tax=hydrothermal vent metagenome TaxID=652676 RepID=A0A1W1CBC6_9ZZZZ
MYRLIIKNNIIIFSISIIFSSILYSSDILLPNSFESNFTQTITTDKKQKIKYSGNIIFSSNNSFKWSYTYPTKKEVCTDGKDLLVVDHDLEQVSAYRVDNGLNLHNILKNARIHRKSVYIAKYKSKNYTIQVDKDGKLSRIAYKDDLDNTVLIVFKNMIYSKSQIDTKNLKCNYPSSYDLIN